MNSEWISEGWLSAVMTTILLVCFLAIVIWAWGGRRKSEFERAARMPLEDAEPVAIEKQKTANEVRS